MKTTSLEVSRELAQHFADNGVEVPESEKEWVVIEGATFLFQAGYTKKEMTSGIYPSYSLEELLDVLPNIIRKDDREYDRAYYLVVKNKSVYYWNFKQGYLDDTKYKSYGNYADAAANLLIWCIEHKYYGGKI